MQLVDTNIILRYLIEDNAKFMPQANKILEKQAVVILTEVLCYYVYTFDKKINNVINNI